MHISLRKDPLHWTKLIPVAAIVITCGSASPRLKGQSVEHGHMLIADQFNNRVIEIDPATHRVVWTFGDGSDKPGPHSVVGTNDAERFGSFTLISGTGIPPSNPTLSGCSDPKNGCPDNRVFIVDWDKDDH
jgi:hypothetical protein